MTLDYNLRLIVLTQKTQDKVTEQKKGYRVYQIPRSTNSLYIKDKNKNIAPHLFHPITSSLTSIASQ